jgi:hypothetical protein
MEWGVEWGMEVELDVELDVESDVELEWERERYGDVGDCGEKIGINCKSFWSLLRTDCC